MSLRSLVSAARDGYTSARPSPDAGGEVVPAGGGGSTGTHSAVQWADDKWWDAMGGPWCAQYRRSATAASIGIGEGEPYRVHFMTPELALEHFRQLPDRYRTNEVLRRECLVVYKDNWYCAEPYAADADHAIEVMKAEVARDVRSGAA